MQEDLDYVKGLMVKPGRQNKTYGPGRRCAEVECITVLSRYNPNDYCGVHGMSPEAKRENMKTLRGGKHAAAS